MLFILSRFPAGFTIEALALAHDVAHRFEQCAGGIGLQLLNTKTKLGSSPISVPVTE